jgi:hypothetical protein
VLREALSCSAVPSYGIRFPLALPRIQAVRMFRARSGRAMWCNFMVNRIASCGASSKVSRANHAAERFGCRFHFRPSLVAVTPPSAAVNAPISIRFCS